MKMKKNSGAAMVTVLIAVTFISIIASSLLYMTYLNYLTKSVRVFGSDNFYTNEFALDEITSFIQQRCMIDSSGLSISTIDDACVSVREACGVGTSYNAGTRTGTYSPAALRNMLVYANTDASAITVSSTLGSNDYVETDTSITLKGVRISTQSKPKVPGDTEPPYSSDIVTDIVINMPKDNSAGPDVNDFSIISDSPLTLADNRAGNVIWGGYIYIKGERGYSSTAPNNKYAVKIDGGRLLSMLSPLAAIDGDVVVTGGSAMTITGKCVIDGSIYVEKDSVLIVTGEVICTGSATANGSGAIKGYGNITFDSSKHLPNYDQTSGLCNDIFARHVYVWDGLAVKDLYNASDATHPLPIDQVLYTNSGIQNWVKTGVTTTVNAGDVTFNNVEYRGFMNVTMDTMNGGSNFAGLLVYTRARPGATEVQLKDNMFGSTILSTDPITYTERSSTRMSKLDNKGYDIIRNRLTGDGNSNGKIANLEMGGFDVDGVNPDYPNFEDLRTYLEEYASGSHSTGTVYRYDAKTGAIDSLSPSDVGDVSKITVDDVNRYLVFDGGKNFIPYGYFLAPETKSIIASYFALINEVDNTPKPYASYDHWTKD